MKVLDIIQESQKSKIYAIGDSHAVAIGKTGKFINLATNGRSASAGENDAAIDQVIPGSTVVLSAGANDMSSSNKQQVVSRVISLISKLQQKKCKVFYILFAETDSPKYSKDRNQLRQLVEASLPSDIEVIDMGKLSIANGDGIHAPMSWYAGVARQVKAEALQVQEPKNIKQSVANIKPDETMMAHAAATQSLSVPNGRVNPEVADIQQILLSLGYKLPKHGVDGVRGPETIAAVKRFQKDYNLAVDGDPGPETVGMLNKLIVSKKIQFAKSTEADVKKDNATAFTGDNPKTSLKIDSVTEGMVGQVLDFVAKYESSGFYDIMFGGKRYPKILEMTLQELYTFGLQHGKRTGSSAAGRYQIMHFNIKPYARKAGLDFNKDLFSPENQDKMGIVFLRECGLDSWLRGKLSNEKFLDKIAMVWAAFAKSDGSSPYNKVGQNGIGLSPKISLAALNDIQNTTA